MQLTQQEIAMNKTVTRNEPVYAGGKEDWVEAGSELEKGSAEVTA